MNQTTFIVFLLLITNAITGCAVWNYVESTYKGYNYVHHTSSGKFIIDNKKIYTVSELMTDEGGKVSFR